MYLGGSERYDIKTKSNQFRRCLGYDSTSLASAAEAGVTTWLSPEPGVTLMSPSVEVSVGYNTQSATKVTRLELWVDGRFNSRKDLIRPETHGVCSFDWNTTRYSDGPHALEVRVFAGDLLLSKVSSTGTVGNTAFDMDPPVVVFSGIKSGDVVKGTTEIKMEARDNSGQPPLVSLLVDDSLKMVRNRAPYTYALDTTTYPDGKHELETYAYDGAGNKSNPAVVNVTFRNKIELPVVTAVAVTHSRIPAVSEDDGADVVQPADVAAVPPDQIKSNSVPSLRSPETPKATPVMGRPVAPVVAVPSAGKIVKPAESAVPVRVAATIQPSVKVRSESGARTQAPTRIAKPVAPAMAKSPAAGTTVATPELKAQAQALAVKPIDVIAKPPAELTPIADVAQPIAKPVAAVGAPKTRTESHASIAVPSLAAVEPVLGTAKTVSRKGLPEATGPVAGSPKPVMIARAPSVRGTEAGMLMSTNAGAQEVIPDPVSAGVRHAAFDPTPRIRTDRQAGCASVSKRVALAPSLPSKSVKLPKTVTTTYVNDVTARTKVKMTIKQLPPSRIEYQAKLERKIIPVSGKVKLRDLVHNLGGVVFWDQATHTVTAYVGDVEMVFVIGSRTAMVNGRRMSIERAPHIIRSRTIIHAETYHQAMAFASAIKTASAASNK